MNKIVNLIIVKLIYMQNIGKNYIFSDAAPIPKF